LTIFSLLSFKKWKEAEEITCLSVPPDFFNQQADFQEIQLAGFWDMQNLHHSALLNNALSSMTIVGVCRNPLLLNSVSLFSNNGIRRWLSALLEELDVLQRLGMILVHDWLKMQEFSGIKWVQEWRYCSNVEGGVGWGAPVDSHWDPVVHISAQQCYVVFLVYLKTRFSNLDYSVEWKDDK